MSATKGSEYNQEFPWRFGPQVPAISVGPENWRRCTAGGARGPKCRDRR